MKPLSPAPKPSQEPAAPAGWTAVARLLRPQGRRGELLAEPLSSLPDLFTPERHFALARATSQPTSDARWIVESHWTPTGKNAGRIVLKLSGCDSISEAERLAGHDLLLESTELPQLDADTWYVRDLLGCTLFDGGLAVGAISGIEYPVSTDGRRRLEDAAPLLEVTPPASPDSPPAETFLVPFLRAWLDSVNLDRHEVRMHLPEGLASPNDNSSPRPE